MADVVSERWTALEQARLALAQFPRREEDLERGLTRLAALGRTFVGVDRISIWDFDREGGRLVLRAVADDQDHRIRELAMPNLGAYADALASHRAIPIPDVAASPLTAALLQGYCVPLGIVSMLDVPVYAGGEVVGVVCHEARGELRAWSDVDAELGLCVAEVASSLRTEHAAREAEEEVRRSEARLAEVVRRAALGRVARGYAHDLKNLLGVVLSSTEVLRARGDEPDVRTQVVATLSDIVTTAERLLEELGEGPDAGVAQPVELDRALGEMQGTITALAGADREFTFETGAPKARIALSPAALEQILINLVVNAREATSPNERIAVRSEIERDDGVGATAVIEVEDAGHGMDERAMARLFEHYFSTKGPRRGIGLSTVQRLVEAAGGWIDVRSEPGGGATFRVHVPVVA